MKKIFSLMAIIAALFIVTAAYADSYVSDPNAVSYISQTVAYSDFTDGGSTAGTLDLTATLPAGAIPIAWRAVVSTGFTGDTSATLLVGISTDTDKFSASDGQNIFAAGTFADSALGEAVGCDAVTSAQTVRLTLTSATDFGDVAAGAMTIKLYYLRP